MSNSKNILILMSGSIAAYKVCDVISSLKKQGHNIKVSCTESALKFVGKATLEGLCGHPVQTDTFHDGEMMDHIYLNKWADITLLAPASANIINKMSAGISDNLVSTLALARDTKKPFIVAPAMNTKMYTHPKTQESLQILKSWGIEVLPTASGELACGDIGPGKLVHTDVLIQKLTQIGTPIKKLKVLITSGGTRESIDGVRHISNMSTGLTGSLIAEALNNKGFDITLLHGIDAIKSDTVTCMSYSDFSDLQNKTHELLGQNHFDVVIQAAAISDFSIDQVIIDGQSHTPSKDLKISSDSQINLSFKKNIKLVSHLKTYSKNKDIKVFAFKLTQTEKKSEQLRAVKKLISQKDIDFVVHNDLLDIKNGKRYFSFYRSEQEFLLCKNIENLNERIQTEILNKEPLTSSPEVQI